jgi:aryl-alcohol dehydrogenase-like predicted oxidoreductase
VQAVQPPCHLSRRGIGAGLLPYAAAHHIGVLACGPLARGLPGGTITEATTFGPGDDLALSRDDLAEIDSIMAAAVPLGGPSPEGMT